MKGHDRPFISLLVCTLRIASSKPICYLSIHRYEYNFGVFPALFLDRDGVIIENRHDYVRSWADVDIYPQALNALAMIHHIPYKIIIVTNQSAVGRGMVNSAEVNHINNRLVEQITRAGGRIDGVYTCPHLPQDNCTCRKPKPGLIYQAAADLSLDLA
ncbi:MAG: HAD-IIIA family hydrolase, partial [Anaerolineaceae bacterium]